MPKKKIICIILLTIIVGLPYTSFSETPYENCPDLYDAGRLCFEEINNPRPGSLPQKHRTVMGFVLGRDSFESAKRLFGKAKMWHSGDASTSEDKICYFTASDKQQVVIVFASNSEMSTGAVDEIRLLKGKFAFLDKCSKTNLPSKKLQTKSGIHIGMSVKKLKSILGQPTEDKRELIVYSYCDKKEFLPEHPLYSSCKDDNKSSAQRCSGITVGIKDDLVQWIMLWFGPDYIC